MTLLNIGDSTFLRYFATSDSGSSLISKLKNTDFSQYILKPEDRDYITGLISRKLTSDYKTAIIKAIQKGDIQLIHTPEGSKLNLPTYLLFFPQMIRTVIDGRETSKFSIMVNFTRFITYDKGKISDVDFRGSMSILIAALAQFNMYTRKTLLGNIALRDNVHRLHKESILKVMGKIIPINSLTADETMQLELSVSAYIAKTVLRIDSENDCNEFLKSLYSKTSFDKNFVTSTLKELSHNNYEAFNSFSNFIGTIKSDPVLFDVCKKLSVPLFMKEWTISTKATSVLGLDLIQYLAPIYVSVSFNSFGIFGDMFFNGLQSSKQLSKISEILVERAM